MTTSENGDDGALVGPLGSALAGSIRSARLGKKDLAAAALAEVLAKEIDLGGDPAKLAPQLLRVLDALQLTPKARAVAQRGGPVERPAAADELDELAARRDRKSHPAVVDTPSP